MSQRANYGHPSKRLHPFHQPKWYSSLGTSTVAASLASKSFHPHESSGAEEVDSAPALSSSNSLQATALMP
ncbi:hypothetical protein V6N12_023315 [Hibiscus sabdariffa]|uniref:Uncharacterized protein n=1 Tax=Hibiscus sabdariffa TaxID=183260 RepID=A0ABR2FXB5_9ROSI